LDFFAVKGIQLQENRRSKKIKVFSTVEELKSEAAVLFAEKAKTAIGQRDRFVVALSGGHSPFPVYRSLADPKDESRIPWKYIHFFWSDERYVPLSDKRSNAGNAMREFLNKVPAPPGQVFPVYRETASSEEAAESYDSLIRDYFTERIPRFDFIFLGCGEDGHTASLFPGSSAINENEKLVVGVAQGESDIARVTMTPLLINQARAVVFIVYGENKASAVMHVLEESRQSIKYPAQAINPVAGELYWLLDEAAASELSKNSEGVYDIAP
jgi:6-phosphogluconolactonase